MRIIGIILVLLALFGGVRYFTDQPKATGSVNYDRGYNVGRIGAPIVFFALGLWLLLRDPDRSRRTRTAPLARPAPVTPPPPAFPPQIPIKINCGCGQHYAFDVEPVAGRMPGPVACPSCGADGTETANAYIAQTLAARMQAMTQAQQTAIPRRRMHPALIAVAGVGALIFLLVAVSVISHFSRIARMRAGARTENRSTSATPPPMTRRGATPATPNASAPQSSKPGSAREAAPVPPGATAVEVLWGNRWWPATIVRRDGERALIHYDGWSSASDEWVTAERMRPRP